jgi:tetratricopeptide (TPR) repeat protein
MEATMRVNFKWLALLLVLVALPLSGCSFSKKLRARDNLNKGVKAFTDQKYGHAAQYFEKAVELDADFEVAQMYLATAYTSQYVPGSNDPKSEEMGKKGLAKFIEIADKSVQKGKPNINAMLTLASLYYQMKKFPESKEWCNKVLQIDGNNAEAYYRIGVMDFDGSLDKTGIQGEMVNLMTNDDKEKTIANIDEGIKALTKAIELRPNYFDAMEFQNLLWREKAKFEKNEKAKAELYQQADLVYQKSIALKLKAKAEEAKTAKKLKLGS